MELFIDTANTNEIKEAFSWGVIDGITTNPSLIKKEIERLKTQGQQVNMQQYIQTLLQVAGQDCPVSLEVTATDAQGMIAQGKRLFSMFDGLAHNVVIKIPINPDVGRGNSVDGLKAIKALEDAEIPVNATLIMTPEQALLAAKAGASYVSPFAGRIDDFLRDSVEMEYQKTDYFPADGEETSDDEEDMEDNGIVSGVDLVDKIVEMFKEHDVDSNVLAASIRNARQLRECALVGADIATVPFAVLKSLLVHLKTAEGMKKFVADIVPEYQQLLGGGVSPSASAQATPQQRAPQQGFPSSSSPSSAPSQPSRPSTPSSPSQATPQQPISRPQPSGTPSAYDLLKK